LQCRLADKKFGSAFAKAFIASLFLFSEIAISNCVGFLIFIP